METLGSGQCSSLRSVLLFEFTSAFMAQGEQQQGFQMRSCSQKSIKGIYLGAACWEILPISYAQTPDPKGACVWNKLCCLP